jgi:iron complex outermembrane recepter protein
MNSMNILPKKFLMNISLMIFVSWIISTAALFAQNGSTASLTGTVTDGNGAVISSASVELTNSATENTVRQNTDQDGRYSFPSVAPGNYRLTVESSGFRQKIISDIRVDSLQNYTNDVVLEIANLSETVVVTGTRSEQQIGKISSAVSVVSADSIQTGQRNSTLEESLKQVPGLRVEDELGGNGARVRITVRGVGTRANSPAGSGVRGVKVLVDGIPKNNAGGSAQDLTNVDLQSAGRIEVLRGPSSVLYGNQSGGVVNIITQEGTPTPFYSYRQTFGAFGLFKEHFKTGFERGRFNFFGSVFRNDQKGYRAQSKFDSTGFFTKLGFTPDSRSSFTAIVSFDRNFQQSPGPLTEAQFRANPRQASPTFVTNNVFAVVKETRLALTYRRSFFDNDDLEITGFVIPRQLGPFSQIGVFIDQFFTNSGLNVRYLYAGNIGNFGNRITGGIEIQDTPILTKTTSKITGLITSDTDEHARTYGFYFLDEFSILPTLTLTVGGRYDKVTFSSQNFAFPNTPRFSRTFKKFTPKIGIAYQATPNLSIYGNVSRGFETPIIGELRTLPGGVIGFNLNLNPQISTNYEIGARGGFLNQKVTFETAFFRQDIRDFISPFGTFPNNSFQNVGKVKQNGFEFGTTVTPVQGLTLRMSYSYSDFVFERFNNGVSNFSGNRLPGIPKHQAFGELRYKHRSGVYGAIESQYSGRFFVDDANAFANPPYAVTNLRFGYEAEKNTVGKLRLTPFIGINNIFDRSYSAFALINDASRRFYNPLPGISVFGGIGVSF